MLRLGDRVGEVFGGQQQQFSGPRHRLDPVVDTRAVLALGNHQQRWLRADALDEHAPVQAAVETADDDRQPAARSEEHTSELQSLMRISYAVFCLTKKTRNTDNHITAYEQKTTAALNHQQCK